MLVSKVCVGCGHPYVCKAKFAATRLYCSQGCFHKTHSWLTERICEICGNPFMPRMEKSHYCSRPCRDRARRVERVEVSCEYCGKKEMVYPSRRAHYRFCSMSCRARALTPDPHRRRRKRNWIVGRTCAQCGQAFEKPSCWNKYFCSHACRDAAKRARMPHRNCEYCGKWFAYKAASPRRFCSVSCYRTHEREEREAHPRTRPKKRTLATIRPHRVRRTREYKEWRWACMERDNFTCRKCGTQDGELQVHHLYPWRRYPHLRFAVSNGHTLCRDCHRPLKGHEDEYLVSVGLSPLTPPLF